MGNRVTLSRLFFLIILISFTSSVGLAQTDLCPNVSSLSYCLQNNVVKTKCVRAKNKDEARVACAGSRTYWDLSSSDYGLSGYSNIWMCSNSPAKKSICESHASDRLQLKWLGDSDAGKCYQDDKLAGNRDFCGFNDLAKDPAAKESPRDVGACGAYSIRRADGSCDCVAGYSKQGEDDTCTLEAVVKTNEKPEDTIKACVDRNVNQAKDCTDKAATTKTLCEKYEKENETSVGVKSFIQTIGSGILQNAQAKASGAMGTSSSNQALCAATSLATSASTSLMSGMMKSCEKEQLECTKACKKDKSLDLKDLCSFVVGGKDKLTDGDKRYIQEQQNKYAASIEVADNYCQIEAPKKNDLLSQTLGDALKAQAAAQSCACANAVDANTCGPTAEQCLANPSLAGCATTPYAINCSLGSADFSQPNCVCLREPSSPSCKTALTSNINNMGTDIKVPTTGDVGLPAVAGTTGDFTSDMDLSSQRAEVSGDGSKAVGKLNTIGETVSGGGGGGLSAPGVGGNGAAAGSGEEDKSLLGSAFGQIKSMAGALFGGGKSAGNGNARGKGDVNFDPDKFKNPKGLRGLASSGMGTKNMDIFKMINTRHIDQDKGGRFFDPSFNPK